MSGNLGIDKLSLRNTSTHFFGDTTLILFPVITMLQQQQTNFHGPVST